MARPQKGVSLRPLELQSAPSGDFIMQNSKSTLTPKFHLNLFLALKSKYFVIMFCYTVLGWLWASDSTGPNILLYELCPIILFS